MAPVFHTKVKIVYCMHFSASKTTISSLEKQKNLRLITKISASGIAANAAGKSKVDMKIVLFIRFNFNSNFDLMVGLLNHIATYLKSIYMYISRLELRTDSISQK